MTVVNAPDEIPLAPEPPRRHTTPAEPLASPAVELAVAPAKAQRLESLDVFRGLTIAAMMVVNNPISWSHMYAPLRHASWHGWTPTDLIFPFFLFIVGVAIPFSIGKRAASESKGEMLAHVWARALSLVLLGLLLNAVPTTGVEPLWPEGFTLLGVLRVAAFVFLPLGFVALLYPWRSRKLSLLMPVLVGVVLLALGCAIHFATRGAFASGLPQTFDVGNNLLRPSHLRFPGVLQRIGVCYGVAATIALFAGWRTVLVSLVLFCGVYSALMLKAPFGDLRVGSLAKDDNFARRVDVAVFDRANAKHTYGEYPDPEGLVSTLPAIGSVLLGVLVGYTLRRTDQTNPEKGVRLLANGVLVSVAGVLLGWWLMPINKPIWTPSYMVFTAGLAMLTLGTVFYLTDVKRRRAWAWPLKVYGMNAIAAFVLAGLIGRVGALIKVEDPWTGRRVAVIQFCKDRVASGVHRAGDWWSQALPYLPRLDTENNVSLAWALLFMLAILLVMMLMYAFRIFLKV